MTTSFDFHTLSLTIDQTLAEYNRARVPGPLGLHLYEVVQGDRSKILRFRHEHAHFTSFLATGLADLYGVFSDYTLALLYAYVHRQMTGDGAAALTLPLIMPGEEGSPAHGSELRRAWDQVNNLQAFLFGFGTSATVPALVDTGPQDDFWAAHFDLCFSRIVQRFYRLLESLATDAGTAYPGGRALPLITVPQGQRVLSARAVMEAYAITIEVLNTHFRGIRTEYTTYSEPVVRNPGPLYTAAVECLLGAGGRNSSLDEFLAGRAPPDVYYLVVAASFAAMQVPVVQQLDGEVEFGGRPGALSPAHRLHRLAGRLSQGELGPVPAKIRGDREALLTWLRSCHRAWGDEDPIVALSAAHERHQSDPALRDVPAHEKSMIQMAWSTRANFFGDPNDFVLDAGMFSERYPCQVRYVRTRDGKLVALGEAKNIQARYLADHTPVMLQAAVFARHWSSTWEKLPEVPAADRADSLAGSIAWAGCLFGDAARGREWKVPAITLRM
ncbi:MAG TPA: hypothetical protein VKE40_24035 [Gemmataceae bacterium]|nr:hypothetical protein [Gemmataceae bacterium]